MTVTGSETVLRSRGWVAVLFTATIFTSALLLFFVQPLYTRMVLPQIGGASAVWTTAMLFFQTVLIGGYLYAHLLSKHLPVPAQVAVHVGLVLLALLFLPLAVPDGWRYDAAAPVVTQTLWLYALGVGLPFAVLSANAPLIQTWYRRSGGPNADDPYFLYAASNLGSLIALLAFPLVAEPLFGVSAISVGWSLGFVALGPMLLLSGLTGRGPVVRTSIATETGTRLSPLTMLRWALLAFLPSSLMLSVTSKISTDLGSFPLVWVVPLALYLLTFVLVFSTRSPLTASRLRLVFPAALAVLLFFCLKPTGTLPGFGLLLAAFFLTSLLAHRLLFDARPDAAHLTVFYLIMSVGGALGGIFNSIIAPLAFDQLIEFPATVVLVATLLVARLPGRTARHVTIGLIIGVVALLPIILPVPEFVWSALTVKLALVVLVLIGSVLLLPRMPLASVVAIAGVLGIWTLRDPGNTVLEDRSFFGLHVIADLPDFRSYSNGTTLHGAQFRDEAGERPTPLLYYHPDGPLAQIVNGPRGAAAKTVGIVGLGTGALSCYARPGQDWHFYEIDQKVVDIALNPDLFTFMTQCGQEAQIHLGDARIVLQGQADIDYDLLVIDAYSSDAVPVHLATVEAIQLYMDRLGPDGLLVFHISNRFYDLEQPLAVAAEALGLSARFRDRNKIEAKVGDVPSNVVILGRDENALGELATDPRWAPMPKPGVSLWTDDHADLLSALKVLR